MKYILNLVSWIIMMNLILSCSSKQQSLSCEFLLYAETLLDSTFHYYQIPETFLFNENYPKQKGEVVTYLANEDTVKTDKVAYLWPTSGMFSAANALLRATGDITYVKLIKDRIVPGLFCYYDKTRSPFCYQSYIVDVGQFDRFYDDNIWIGLDFLECFNLTNDSTFLTSAIEIWKFIESGRDSILGDGIYWCEQKKESKNVCSNAPAAVLALKLYETTRDKYYLEVGNDIYSWTKNNLQDPQDGLYFDNIALNGTINKTKFQYNSGQMMQAAALLYKLTNQTIYLADAQMLAKSCDEFFFENFCASDGKCFRAMKNGNIWFVAVMLRGFEELYTIDKNPTYLLNITQTLSYVWKNNPNTNRLFEDECFVNFKSTSKNYKWLLTQAAMIEMYARMSTYNFNNQ